MIDRDRMFVLLLDAHPGFSELWSDFVDEWSDIPEGLPHYLFITDVVHECSKMFARGEKLQLRKVFEVVEAWIDEGDHYVKEVAIVGFIEDLQSANSDTGAIKPEDFIEFLGPESRYYWRKVERFLSHGELIVDDR